MQERPTNCFEWFLSSTPVKPSVMRRGGQSWGWALVEGSPPPADSIPFLEMLTWIPGISETNRSMKVHFTPSRKLLSDVIKVR